MKQKINAQIIADSKNEFGQRITTFVLTFPRMILAEYNTHRMLTRNSASSRAIPFKKMLSSVMTDPFIPIAWMKDHSGMQGNTYFGKESEVVPFILRQLWLTARNFAVIVAWMLSKIGLTKQIVNRLLEPFLWHKIITTSTEWENFFSLRAEGAAEIHMQELALVMLDEYNKSEPILLKAGEWHLPFGDNIELNLLLPVWNSIRKESDSLYPSDDCRLKIATARCARTSYNNFDGTSDYEKDIQLHDRLALSGHWSPFEHCAQAMTKTQFENSETRFTYFTDILEPGWCGNFKGFIQYRKTFQNENRKDNRVVKK